MEKKTKKKNKKKILALAMVLALIIVIGGTFAWFTSKDEVTNRLSSESDYNVAITENYTPVKSMTPGTTVTKEVAAVNTGSVDAFVKMTVSGQLELTTYTTGDSTYDSSNVSSYVALSTDSSANEVTSLQAGAILAYTTNTNDASSVGTLYTDGTGFTPDSSGGFYVFARSVTATGSGNTWEYVGYYYVDTNYYAVTVDASSSTINSDGTISTTGTAPTLTIDKTTTSVIEAGSTSGSNIVFSYDSANSRIVATYDPDNDSNSGDEIIFYINLDTDYANNWTVDSTNMTFYYNYILASGATSKNLIATVELADSVSESSYVSLNFDLDIILDSIQVSSDTTNLAEAVNSDTSWWYAYGGDSGENVTTTTTSLTWQSSEYTK